LNPGNTQDAKVALVTGGARRIGASIVRYLHASGYKVVLQCRHSISEANALATSLNKLRSESVLVLQHELTLPCAPHEIMSDIKTWAKRLDVLVNNASIFTRTELKQFLLEDWDSLFNIHVKVPFSLSLAARAMLTTQSGAIINITDTHADKPLKGYSVY